VGKGAADPEIAVIEGAHPPPPAGRSATGGVGGFAAAGNF